MHKTPFLLSILILNLQIDFPKELRAMEVRGGKTNRAPADEMRKFRIVRTFIEVAHYLFR